MSWAISYHFPGRPDEAGVKLVHSEEEAIAEKRHLESRGYVVTKADDIDTGQLLEASP